MNKSGNGSDQMLKIAGLGHVGLLAKDPVELSKFYRDLFGMEDVGQVPNGIGPMGGMAFLSSRRQEENHELVFFQDAQGPHIAYKVASLADLRAWHTEIKARGLPIVRSWYHGSSYAFYFPDPEGHLIELYWPTGSDVTQPVAETIDFDRPEEELLAAAGRAITPPSGT